MDFSSEEKRRWLVRNGATWNFLTGRMMLLSTEKDVALRGQEYLVGSSSTRVPLSCFPFIRTVTDWDQEHAKNFLLCTSILSYYVLPSDEPKQGCTCCPYCWELQVNDTKLSNAKVNIKNTMACTWWIMDLS